MPQAPTCDSRENKCALGLATRSSLLAVFGVAVTTSLMCRSAWQYGYFMRGKVTSCVRNEGVEFPPASLTDSANGPIHFYPGQAVDQTPDIRI
jgi:hypothetical protein